MDGFETGGRHTGSVFLFVKKNSLGAGGEGAKAGQFRPRGEGCRLFPNEVIQEGEKAVELNLTICADLVVAEPI